MAITADLLLAVAITTPIAGSPPLIRLANVQTTMFPMREFSIPKTSGIEIDASSHEWGNYFKAGLHGALSLLRQKQKDPVAFVPVGMDILVDGTVPSGGGLSSSAA